MKPIAFATATPENKTIDLPGPEKLNKLFKSRDDINVSKLSTESGEIWDRVAYQNNVTTDRLFAMLRLSKDLRDYQSLHPNELESESSNKTFELIVSRNWLASNKLSNKIKIFICLLKFCHFHLHSDRSLRYLPPGRC